MQESQECRCGHQASSVCRAGGIPEMADVFLRNMGLFFSADRCAILSQGAKGLLGPDRPRSGIRGDETADRDPLNGSVAPEIF